MSYMTAVSYYSIKLLSPPSEFVVCLLVSFPGHGGFLTRVPSMLFPHLIGSVLVKIR